jgi:hypothetical protein
MAKSGEPVEVVTSLRVTEHGIKREILFMIHTGNTNRVVRYASRFLGGAAMLAAVCMIPTVSAQDRDQYRMTRIEPGTNVSVRTSEGIDVDRRDDRVFRGVVDQDVRGENGRVAIPRGAPVELVVRVAPDNDLIIDLNSVTVNGQRYALKTDPNRQESQRDNSLVGAIIGAVSGEEVRGRAVHIHSNAVLNFRIDHPMEMAVAYREQSQDRDRSTRIEPGTVLAVRTSEVIDVDRRDDRVFRGVVDQDIRGDNGRLAIPRGAQVELIVRVAPDKDLTIDVESVMVNGRRYAIKTDPSRVESHRDESLVGSIIGAVTGDQVHGRAVHIHSDSVLNFRIDRPMDMGVADRGQDRDGMHYHPYTNDKK